MTEPKREADPVDVVAEAIYNCREERDPCGDLDDRVHPGEQPRRLPLLWAEVLERGLFPADVDEAYADARRVLAALAAADREAPDEAGRICCRGMGADGGCNICAAEATR